MGQYFMVVNTTKEEYLHPHDFGSGLKFMEFTSDQMSVMTGLAHLLAQSSDGGLGDDPEITGRWIGDNILIVGDYDDSGLYDKAYESYQNISQRVIQKMCKHSFVKEVVEQRTRWSDGGQLPVLQPDMVVVLKPV